MSEFSQRSERRVTADGDDALGKRKRDGDERRGDSHEFGDATSIDENKHGESPNTVDESPLVTDETLDEVTNFTLLSILLFRSHAQHTTSLFAG